MNIFAYIFLALLIFSIWATVSFIRRTKVKAGCVTGGYVFGVIFLITLFTAGITVALSSYVYRRASVALSGEKYVATIVDYGHTESQNSNGKSKGNTYPVVSFATETGDSVTLTTSEPYLSDRLPEIGSPYELYYDASSGKHSSFGANAAMALFGMLFMLMILVAVFIFIVKFALGQDMKRYWSLVRKGGIAVLIPMIMIAFDALLIYVFFYGNEVPGWVSGFLLFFIIMLTLGILGYIKKIFVASSAGHMD